MTVGDLREKCAKALALPASNIQIIFNGMRLVSNDKTLNGAGIASGARILAMASKDRPIAQQTDGSVPSSRPVTPSVSVVAQIDESLEKTRTTLMGPVETYAESPPKSLVKIKEEHDRLAELLLQQLLKLDQFEIPMEGPDKEVIRAKRKDGVKWTQGLIDKVCGTIRATAMLIDVSG